MRELAKSYQREKNWVKVIQCMQKALDLNSLRQNDWFLLGHAAQQTENFKLGCDAFLRVLQINPEASQAWANLGACHACLKKYKQACYALGEAVKLRPKNWKMWANLRTFAADAGNWYEVIRSSEQLITIYKKKGKEALRGAFDPYTAMLLIKHVIACNDDVQMKHLREQASKFISRVCNTLPTSPIIWGIASTFYKGMKNEKKEMECKLLQCRALQIPRWNKDVRKFEMLAGACLQLAEKYEKHGSSASLYSGYMFLKSIVKGSEELFRENGLHAQLVRTMNKLRDSFESM
jgi:tetratricopeptide (TPR) repeat protein